MTFNPKMAVATKANKKLRPSPSLITRAERVICGSCFSYKWMQMFAGEVLGGIISPLQHLMTEQGSNQYQLHVSLHQSTLSVSTRQHKDHFLLIVIRTRLTPGLKYGSSIKQPKCAHFTVSFYQYPQSMAVTALIIRERFYHAGERVANERV